jgi:hypothetical protein
MRHENHHSQSGGHDWLYIQAYLGYYVASKLCFFTPGLIHRISSRDGCYLAMGCLPLNITNRYFILREWVHQYNGHGRGAIDLVYHGSTLLGHRQACMDQGGRRGLFRIDELGASDRCRTGLAIWVILEVVRLIVWSDWPPCFGVESETES